ncbi:DNA-binding transcriptional regulator, MerR family [Desulfocicer vacuolatum DSM 3385]|uniref:DNA-binding transcriptional regulator, MerR family n=1 Tax=Desulfocicer vacuolatum DSM 3385 TaxID=1121400 RepID=A0A1W2CV17_9BACT|nr:MerR family transcriptional regulator [Desulfocicer vacuolatum]SMC88806.1 DNA-binding transcriptional regulator, MerR family [Desulfocicer vacuolatum DSM 3385]
MKINFLTGEMAKLHGISRQTLLYYDKIGLLKPKEVDEINNYRYYTLDQFETLDVILSLKSLGMTLKEIKHYLSKASLSDRMEQLKLQDLLIREKIEQLERTGRRLTSFLTALKQGMEITPFEIGIKFLKKRYILIEPVQPPFEWYDLEMAIKKLIACSRQEEIVMSGYMVYVDNDEDGQEIYRKVALEIDHDAPDCIAAGEYGYLYHQGPYEDLGRSRSLLQEYIEKSKYQVSGEIIEKVLLDTFAVSDETQYLVEIQIPVQKLNNSMTDGADLSYGRY